ncbi:META domain-containing protein [Ruegeria faecimaris]|uniref:META domain-containing protein n=1 Tax=Ruegeria faecimaris TaxID=686389 RepID=UPI00232DEABD|nr:META domain-containing protein [Ruegeria faecimaris]
MLRYIMLLSLSGLPQCQKDETVAAYGAAEREWALQEINGQPYNASALLRFLEEGKVTGNAPCNSYTGRLNVPYPWFELTGLTATRAACAGLEAEGIYFAALLAMTQSEVSGNLLILRNEDGQEMVFKAAD